MSLTPDFLFYRSWLGAMFTIIGANRWQTSEVVVARGFLFGPNTKDYELDAALTGVPQPLVQRIRSQMGWDAAGLPQPLRRTL